MTDRPDRLRLNELIARINATDGDDPLRQVTDAKHLADQIDQIKKELVSHFVHQALQAGATWADIGRHLGMTRQSAQERYGVDPSYPFDEQDVDR